MRQIKLTIEYEGTSYVGWQRQPNGISIQQVMEEALARLTGEPVRLQSSGRTDARVHARGMIAAFFTEKNLPLSAYCEGMNCTLPPDIAVLQAEDVPLDFNPRHDAQGKHYRYSIHIARCRSPLLRNFVWHLRDSLDLGLMRQGAEFFVGEHDFAAYRTSGCAAKTTVRRIDRVEIASEGSLLHINVYGTGFLRNMVRIMAGTLVEIGRGKLPPERVRDSLLNPALKAGMTAPPEGLCLMEVFY